MCQQIDSGVPIVAQSDSNYVTAHAYILYNNNKSAMLYEGCGVRICK